MVGHIDLDLAELSVFRVVRGIVTQHVLTAQFFGDLIERFFQPFLGVNDDQSPSGILCQLACHSGVTAIAWIINQQNVDHRIGALRGFEGWAVRSVPRDQNRRADAIVNEALDAA